MDDCSDAKNKPYSFDNKTKIFHVDLSLLSSSAPGACSVKSDKMAGQFNRKFRTREKRRVAEKRHVEIRRDTSLTPVNSKHKTFKHLTSKPVNPAGDSDYITTVRTGLRRLEGDSDSCDITLLVQERKFDCHLLILCTFSNYFRCHVQTTLGLKQTVKLDMVEADTMELVLHFMYTGEVKVTKHTARDLLFTAAYLQITCLQGILEQRHAQFLGSENVLDYWQLADIYPDYHLLSKRCKKIAILCFQTIIETSKFVHLSLSRLLTLLFSDNLNVSEENIVFDAMMKWIHFDFPDRSRHVRTLVDSIRLPLINGVRYRKLKATFPVLFVEPLNDYIREAEMFHADVGAQMRYSSPRTELRPGAATEKGILVIIGPTYSHGQWNDLPYVSEKGEVKPRDTEKHMKIWCFSLITRRWKQLGILPTYPGPQFTSCTYGLYDLFLSGEHGMYRYSARENTWVTCESPPGRGRKSHGMQAVNDRLYIFGGKTVDTLADYAMTVEVYDVVHEKWKEKPFCEITTPVSNFHSVAVRNKIYIFSRFTRGLSHEHNVSSTLQCIDINTHACTIVSHVAAPGPVVSQNTEIHQVIGQNLVKYWPGCQAFVNALTLDRDCSKACLVRLRSKILIIGATQSSSESFSDVIMEFDFNKRAKKMKTWREKLPEVEEEIRCHLLLVPKMTL